MRRKNMIRKAVVVVTVCMIMMVQLGSHTASAKDTVDRDQNVKSPNYITGVAFIKKLVTVVGIEVDQTEEMPYVNAAFRSGLLNQGEIENIDANITRTDCALLLERADEYLDNESLSEDLIKIIIDKRISDIKKVPESKRAAVANVYGKGMIKGYSNGMGVQNREFRGENYVSNGTAKNFINLLMNPKKRAKISPDGQLIRTTNLPKNADKFEYILECFPNKFYEMKFRFQRYNEWDEKKQELARATVNEDYCYPEYVRKMTYQTVYTEYPMKDVMDRYFNTWMERAESYVRNVFNVDYRTIGDEWVEAMIDTCGWKGESKDHKKMLNCYVRDMKKYKTIVKSKLISVEPSTFYHSISGFYVRVYVKYKVSATEIPKDQRDLVFSCLNTYIPNLRLNTWQTGVYDIWFDDLQGFDGDGSAIYPSITNEIYSPY